MTFGFQEMELFYIQENHSTKVLEKSLEGENGG